MAANDSFAFLATEDPPKPLESQSKAFKKINWGGSKLSGQRTNWRDKLFSKEREAKQIAENEREVDEFLGRSRPPPSHPLPAIPTQTPTLPPVDNLILDSRPQKLDTPPSSPEKRPGALESYVHTAASPPKPQRRKGLRVVFSTIPPQIIGEGGDESEEPTVEISLNRNRAPVHVVESPPRDEYDDLEDRRPTLPELHLDTSFAGNPTGGIRAHEEPGWKPLLASAQDQDFLLALPGERGSRLSIRTSSDSHSVAKRVQARMQAEEGMALQQHLEDDPTSPPPEEDGLRRQQEQLPLRPSFTSQRSHVSQQSLNVEDGMSSVPSLRASPVPAVHEMLKGIRQDLDSADVLSPGSSSSHSLSPPSSEKFTPSAPPAEAPRRPVSPEESPVFPKVEPAPVPRAGPKMTLRAVANAMGDGAYHEFTTYVEQYGRTFHMAAEQVKPLMETSFSEWVRAAAWWFLKGRTGLEAAVRSGRSPDKKAAEQAVLDLGKAWWICQEIVPLHPELTRYGRMSMDALAAVIYTTGEQRLAGLVNLHQKTAHHLRALTVSMKRNQVLSAVTSDAAVTDQPVDSSIWVRYPFFAADISAVLSGGSRRSMLVDSSLQMAYTPDMMLLADTSRFFSYGTMFVEVSIVGDDDYDAPQYAIPCVLSIKRDRSDWYVLAAIASQSALVNITIQSDRKDGPTWDDVDWQVKTRTMTIKLRRGFELNVAFQEKDFKMIWKIVQYTLKTEKSLQPEPGETMIFDDTLKVFQYMDSGTPKAFPPEPSPHCRLALFEKFVTLSEGTGRRRAHRGFRLAVVTSPQTKTLSSIRHTLGYGAPIVFGYLRGENGAPALLLNTKEDGRAASMVLTFDKLERRTALHSLLVGMLASENEFTSPDIPIRSFSIDQPGDSVTGSSDITHLKFSSGSVSVIDLEPDLVEHGYGPNILSEHLRVLISTDWGTVTDRINIGEMHRYASDEIFWLTKIRTGRDEGRSGHEFQNRTLHVSDRPRGPDRVHCRESGEKGIARSLDAVSAVRQGHAHDSSI
jgi:hypothetical protein